MTLGKKPTLSEPIFIRLSEKDRADLDALSARVPAFSRAALAREALRLGIRLLSEDVTRLVSAPDDAALPARRRRD